MNQVTTNPVAINDIFKGFYTNLYKAETDFDEPICKQYLDKLEIPRIRGGPSFPRRSEGCLSSGDRALTTPLGLVGALD